MKDEIQKPATALVENISQLIQQAQQHVLTTINSTMVVLYWHIGKNIQQDIVKNDRAEYGKSLVRGVAQELTIKYGRGYSYSNITRMVDFYNAYSDYQIIATLSQQLSWSHFVELLKLKDELSREFYLTMAINERWSTRQLSERINSMLFERTAISKKPDQTIAGDLQKLREQKQMSIDLFVKDPLILDFLSLSDHYSEQDLESAILAELQRFILEMGSDFAFMARQKRITVGGEDYYIDLLFYHRKLKRLVVVELKLGKFRVEFKSQMELYLRWLDTYERQAGEQSPIGILLCADKQEELVELLELDKANIHVSSYLTELPSKEILRQKLLHSIEIAKKRLSTIATSTTE